MRRGVFCCGPEALPLPLQWGGGGNLLPIMSYGQLWALKVFFFFSFFLGGGGGEFHFSFQDNFTMPF
jgi:hypothetical protein